MKKILVIMFMLFGVAFATQAASPIVQLGKAVGELVILPFGVVVGACEGIYDGVTYLVTGEVEIETTTKTTYTQTSTAPVYVVPSQPKSQGNIIINDSPGASVTINQSTTTKTPTVIYVPSSRPNYYYYRPYLP